MSTLDRTTLYTFFRSAIAVSSDWLLSIFKARSTSKTHDYTQLEKGCDYIFEPVDGGSRGYMTGQRAGIKCGDIIVLDESQQCRYRVKEIDYYSNPPDVWIALLDRID